MTKDFKDSIVEISKLLMKDEKSQLEHVKNLTLSIEANLYHKFSKEVSKGSQYGNISRLVTLILLLDIYEP